jgi:serine/threonine protein phosphatase 1
MKTKPNRTLVIGDIHGGYKALLQVLDRAGVSETDTLIFLGDYVDGWSQSPQILDFLIELQTQQNCIFIKGNHDDLLLDWLTNNTQNIDETMWYKHGGKATVEAYKTISDEQKSKHILFLQNLRNSYIDNQNRLFVHAGFTNQNGIDSEYFPAMLYWDRTLWEMALSLNPALETNNTLYPKRLLLYTEIYIGHTPTTKINQDIPVNAANVWNIDTGAGFWGKLTALDIDTKQFWQSDSLPSLYPNESGRN